MAKQILIIGGNAAGISAASRAKRLDPHLEITVIELSNFVSYSICGLPYYISKKIEPHERLVRFTPEALEAERHIRVRTRTRVERIFPSRRKILCFEDRTKREWEIPYDRLVLATGYHPKLPRIEGYHLDGVLTVSRLEDGIHIRRQIETRDVRRVAVIGGGYVGLMMVNALKNLGIEVILFEQKKILCTQVDEDMAVHIVERLRGMGVTLKLGTRVRRLKGNNNKLEGVLTQQDFYPVDLALIDIGISPNVTLALDSGLKIGTSGAIWVDERGQTSARHIYAAGNCAETIHRVSEKAISPSLGTSAAKQGRVVGENLAGRRSLFGGTLETSVEQVFDLAIARTGLTMRQAFNEGFKVDSVKITDRTKAAYYPGTSEMHVKLIFEKNDGRLLGGQIIGDDSTGKRIDTLVTAISAGMTLQDVSQLDLAYAPPFGTLWDPIHIAANVGIRKLKA